MRTCRSIIFNAIQRFADRSPYHSPTQPDTPHVDVQYEFGYVCGYVRTDQSQLVRLWRPTLIAKPQKRDCTIWEDYDWNVKSLFIRYATRGELEDVKYDITKIYVEGDHCPVSLQQIFSCPCNICRELRGSPTEASIPGFKLVWIARMFPIDDHVEEDGPDEDGDDKDEAGDGDGAKDASEAEESDEAGGTGEGDGAEGRDGAGDAYNSGEAYDGGEVDDAGGLDGAGEGHGDEDSDGSWDDNGTVSSSSEEDSEDSDSTSDDEDHSTIVLVMYSDIISHTFLVNCVVKLLGT